MKKEFTPSEYKYPSGGGSPLNFNTYAMRKMIRNPIPESTTPQQVSPKTIDQVLKLNIR